MNTSLENENFEKQKTLRSNEGSTFQRNKL